MLLNNQPVAHSMLPPPHLLKHAPDALPRCIWVVGGVNRQQLQRPAAVPCARSTRETGLLLRLNGGAYYEEEHVACSSSAAQPHAQCARDVRVCNGDVCGC